MKEETKKDIYEAVCSIQEFCLVPAFFSGLLYIPFSAMGWDVLATLFGVISLLVFPALILSILIRVFFAPRS